jgi:nicotinamide-nucleotide amidase
VGESFLAEQIADIEDSLPSHIKLAYLPNLGQVRLRLSGFGQNAEELTEQINVHKSQLKERISKYLITDVDKPLEKAILDLMDANKLTLAVAESCTGGYISHVITQHPGCSSVFLGGAISYSNEVKQSMLGVKTETVDRFGAVSEETAKEMSGGVILNYKSDYAIAVTGIAGPDGGTPEKPVGTVWISVANKHQVVAKRFQFGNKRIQNIQRSAVSAFVMLLDLIKADLQEGDS